MSGRGIWFMKDSGWYQRNAVKRAKREFGAVGPAVMDWLECAAKRENQGGRLKTGVLAIADEIGEEEVTVCDVVRRLVTWEWLIDYEDDGDTFKATIAWFAKDQEQGLHAKRQADYRDKQKESGNQSVTDRHAPSPTVTGDEERREVVRAKALTSELEKASDEDRALCRLFYSLGRQSNPKMTVPGRDDKSQANALTPMRKLRDLDEQPVADIERLVRWVFTGGSEEARFWGKTIQAPSGLRNNFGKAWAAMLAESPQATTHQAKSVAELVAEDEARRRTRIAA